MTAHISAYGRLVRSIYAAGEHGRGRPALAQPDAMRGGPGRPQP